MLPRNKGDDTMATIVTYSERMRPVNAYPVRIVSPERPSACCTTHMHQIGDLRIEGSGLYYYQRCRRCGFAVRHFLPRVTERPLETIPDVGGIFKVTAMAREHSYTE